MQTNEFNLTCTQKNLLHCFDFVLQGCLGDWDRAFFEQPFWKIIVFKNQTNLFDYEGSRSLNSCNQICFILLNIVRLSLQRQSRNEIYESHCWVQTRRVLQVWKFFWVIFEDLRIWEILSLGISSCGVWQF